jgi:predicted DNA-binding protein
MTISLRLNDNDSQIVKNYAALNDISVSEFVRRIIIERIEDERDLKIYEKALENHKSNPVTYSLEEVKKELGFQ